MSSFQGSGMPPFLEDFTRRLLQGAFDRTKDPLPGGIPKQTIVGMQPLQTGAIAEMAKGFGLDPVTGRRVGQTQVDPEFQRAQDAIGAAQQAVTAGLQTTTMGIPSLQAAQAQFDPSTSNYQQFFDQYQKDVTKEALKQMDEQAAVAQQNLATQAQKAGAFGGSRMGVQEAELAKNLQDIKSRRIFQDLSQNFQQAQAKAMNTFESAAQRRLKAAPQFANVGRFQAGIGAQGAGLGLQGANLAQQQFALQQQGLGSLFGIGQQQQALAQQQEAERFRQDVETQQEGLKRLGFFSDILRGVPSSGQQLTASPPVFTNPLLGALGLGLGTFNLFTGGQNAGDAFSLMN